MDKSEKELAKALERIADLHRELGRDPKDDPFYFSQTDPATLAASRIKEVIQREKRMADEPVQEALRTAELYERMAARAPDEDREEEARLAAERRAEYEEKKTLAEEHIAALDRKLNTIARDPKELFLPLGTHVRFNGEGMYERADKRSRWSIPEVGTEGVVVRLNTESEWPIAVAFIGKFICGGTELNQSNERPHIVHFDRANLDVLAPGLLPDGTECEAFGYLPTHTSNDDDGTRMFVESNGRFWEFREHTYERGRVDSDRAYDDLTKFEDDYQLIHGGSGLRM